MGPQLLAMLQDPNQLMMLNNMYFNGDKDMFAVFSGNGQYKGYDVLSFANNHTLDKGKEGLLSTIKFLENKK